jgi:hypothetical protein
MTAKIYQVLFLSASFKKGLIYNLLDTRESFA